MKIGILTFHFACNYGAVLQCLALQEYLSACGHDVHVIDYRPYAVAKGYRWLNLRNFLSYDPARMVRKTMAELKVIADRRLRYAAFDQFVTKNLNLSAGIRNVKDVEKLALDYDMIVIGSDQVWNTKITGGIDRIYWGDFKHGENTSLVSYAASMEDASESETCETIRKVLPSFKAVSVREESLKARLNEIIPSLPVDVCVDPTLLRQSESWEDMIQSPVTDEEYLLFYQVRKSQEAYDAARKIAEDRKLKLFCLSAELQFVNSPEVAAASPSDFLSLFRNASFVVTTSFHGTIFSILNEKEFLSFGVDDGRNSRQSDLLKSLGLYERFMNQMPDILPPCPDWNVVRRRLQELRTGSESFLRKCGV